MIDEYADRNGVAGWARFSDCRTFRYRLGRSLKMGVRTKESGLDEPYLVPFRDLPPDAKRIVWVLLNPSTADAFKPDPTVSRCMEWSRLWGADACEVVNLFAFRSTFPQDLLPLAIGARGDDALNDEEILSACLGATKVVIAYGNHGTLDDRNESVLDMLTRHGVEMWHLARTKFGHPRHPLARGKEFIPYSQTLEIFT